MSGTVDDELPETNVRTVFAGLMLGMFLAAINQTIVAPAMPRIVAELGGMSHYSWIAVSSLLAATVAVPIVGKLSDLFGRKAFYVGGIVLFMVSSLVAGLTPSFEVFIVARVLEGLGMGTMMPLSQAIIGDIVSPRERGKYQGLMGAVFGLASVVGPFVGGWITDSLGWRWLFFANIPLGAIALGFIIPFMHLPFRRRPHTIDYGGFVTLTVGLTATLLAVTWGGTELAWNSPTILGLFAVGGLSLGLFVWIERHAVEPVLPPRLWRNDIFTTSNLAVMGIAMAMFGAIYYIPVFVQGVLGASVTGSGAVLTPMMLSIVGVSTVTGLLISKTGRYKLPVLLGISLIAIGFYLLAQMDRTTTYGAVVRNMIFIGLGLGASMQTFVLIVQNAVGREDLGVATATTQLFRSIGASAGTAILGSILTSQMHREMARTSSVDSGLAPEALEPLQRGGELGAGAVLDPASLAHLPPELLEQVRVALAAALQPVFSMGLVFVGLAFAAAIFIREIPLRRTIGSEPSEAGKDLLAELNQAGAEDAEPVLGHFSPAYRERTAFLGVLLSQLATQAADSSGGELHRAILHLGHGDSTAGLARLQAAARALLRECAPDDLPSADDTDAAAEGVQGDVDDLVHRGVKLDDDIRDRMCDLDPVAALERVMAQRPADLGERLHTLATHTDLKPSAVLTPADLEAMERVAVVLGVAMLRDRES